MDPDRVGIVGIIEAIEHELMQLERTGKFKTKLNVQGDLEILSKDKTIILYRIVQEVLNNIIKHSKADSVIVNIGGDDKEDYVVIEDNGIGFVQQDESNNGLGLKNITNRAKLIGGQAIIRSMPNEGTSIRLCINKK